MSAANEVYEEYDEEDDQEPTPSLTPHQIAIADRVAREQAKRKADQAIVRAVVRANAHLLGPGVDIELVVAKMGDLVDIRPAERDSMFIRRMTLPNSVWIDDFGHEKNKSRRPAKATPARPPHQPTPPMIADQNYWADANDPFGKIARTINYERM